MSHMHTHHTIHGRLFIYYITLSIVDSKVVAESKVDWAMRIGLDLHTYNTKIPSNLCTCFIFMVLAVSSHVIVKWPNDNSHSQSRIKML